MRVSSETIMICFTKHETPTVSLSSPRDMECYHVGLHLSLIHIYIHNELSNEEVGESNSNFSMAELEGEVFNSKYTFLVDSGSEITAIDDKIFEKIKNQTTETIPQLPVSVSYTHLDVYKRQHYYLR